MKDKLSYFVLWQKTQLELIFGEPQVHISCKGWLNIAPAEIIELTRKESWS